MKQFDITFTENKKYNPATRTVRISNVNDELHARTVFASEYDSFKRDERTFLEVPTGKHVRIAKVEEVKEKKEKTKSRKGKKEKVAV